MHLDSSKLYPGRLSTGDAATSRAVVVRLTPGGIEIDQGRELPVLLWRYGVLASGVPVTKATRDLLVKSADHPGATLYVNVPAFAAALAVAAPTVTAWTWRIAGLKPAGGITAAVLAFAGAITLSGFSPSKTIAGLIPDNARTLLGQRVVASLVGKYRVCSTKTGNIALARLMKKLADAAGTEKPFKVVVVNWGLVNAFAAPGGQLVLTRGLITKAKSAGSVAGVMAHEMGHGIERHPETGLVRAIGLSAAAEFFFTGSASSLKNIGLILTTLSYTRDAEREADAHALRILRQGNISAEPLAQFFEGLAKKQKKSSVGRAMTRLPILSTHPPSPERAKMFAEAAGYKTRPAMSGTDWKALREICGKPRKKLSRKEVLKKRRERAKKQVADSKRTIETMSRLIEADSGDAAAFRKRARAYALLKQHEKAILDYTAAIELEPDKTAHYEARAKSYKAMKRWDEAVANYGELIRLKPDRSKYRRYRGNLYIKKKNWDAAIADFNESVRLSPKYTSGYRGYTGRARAKRGKGDMNGALADLDEALKLRPKSGASYLERGQIRQQIGRGDDAMADFDKAVSFKWYELRGRVARGLAYEQRSKRKLAILDYRKALSLKAYRAGDRRDQAKARKRLLALGVVIKKRRRFKTRRSRRRPSYVRQIAKATKMITADPQNIAAYKLRARAYFRTGKLKEAVKDYTQAIKLQPDNAYNYHGRAVVFEALRNWHAVIADIDRALELKPDKIGAHLTRGRAFAKLGDDAEAMKDFNKTISVLPTRGYVERGKLFAAKGARDKALKDFTAAIAINDEAVEAYYLKGMVLEQSGETTRAIANYGTAVSLKAYGSNNKRIQADAAKRLQKLIAAPTK